MRRDKEIDLLFDPEVERLLRKNRKANKKKKRKEKQQRNICEEVEVSAENLAENCAETISENFAENMEGRQMTLEELYTPNAMGCGSSITPPNVAANNFEIKPALTQLVRQEQFGGLEEEDPNQHVHNFLQICGTIKMNGVPDDAIRLRLFEFSLKGEAKMWLQSFPHGYFTTWDALVNTFLAQYFPPEKYNYFRAEISCFKQKEGESISEAWRRFKSLLRRCPHHGFSDLHQIHIFYNGLRSHTRLLVDASAGGSLRKKDAIEARMIIETMASNRYDAPSDFYGERRGVMELGASDALLAQNKLLSQKLDLITKQLQSTQINAIQVPQIVCDFCGGGHPIECCDGSGMNVEEPAQVNYMGNPQGNSYSNTNTYNPHQRNHPNLSYKNNNFLQPNPSYNLFLNQNQNHSSNQTFHPNFHSKPPFNPINQNSPPNQPFNQNKNQPPTSTFNPPHSHFTPNHSNNAPSSSNVNPNPEGSSSNLENVLMTFMQQTQSLFQNQGASIRNLETQIGQLSKQMAERNQGTLPSDTIINPKEQCNSITTRSGKVLGEENEELKEDEVEKKEELRKEEQPPTPTVLKEVGNLLKKTKKQIIEEAGQHEHISPYCRLPYPQRLKKDNEDKQFSKFFDILKNLRINIPFSEALQKMPSYAKFMKELLSNKRMLLDDETVAMTEECSAIIQRKLPQKLRDKGPFTIPCSIGDVPVGRALIDLGASINLIPLSILRKLNIHDIQPTMMTLQLADRSIKHPYGVVEDLLVKVDKFTFPADFVVLDVQADEEVPIILGRPFLATGRVLIDVAQGELILRVEEEKVSFNIFDAMKFSSEKQKCMMIDVLNPLIENVSKNESLDSKLNEVLLKTSSDFEKEQQGVKEFIAFVEANTLSSSCIEQLEETPKVDRKFEHAFNFELKQLPSHLHYAFLEANDTFPVIISNSFTKMEEEKLLEFLKVHKSTIGYKIFELKEDMVFVSNEEIDHRRFHEPLILLSDLMGSSISSTSTIPRYVCLEMWDPGGSSFDSCNKFLASNFKPP